MLALPYWVSGPAYAGLTVGLAIWCWRVLPAWLGLCADCRRRSECCSCVDVTFEPEPWEDE